MKFLVLTDMLTSPNNGLPELFPLSHRSLLNGCGRPHGLDFRDAEVLAVFPDQSGVLDHMLGSKAEGVPDFGPLVKGKYLKGEYAFYLEKLYDRIAHEQADCILTLGPVATWALLGTANVRDIRGVAHESTAPLRQPIKVFPTYHPRSIFAEWELRAVLYADLCKFAHERTFPEVRRPSREIWIEPDLGDLVRFEQQHILPAPQLSIDIETAGKLITCIGFAPTESVALVVPFVTKQGLYWDSESKEVLAWQWVKHICRLPKAVCGQNFLYDAHHLWRNYGITVPHVEDDSMLLHHAMQPELPKKLSFLASLYTYEASWKFMRKEVKTIKKED